MTLENIRSLESRIKQDIDEHPETTMRSELDMYADLAMVGMLQWELTQWEKTNFYTADLR